MLIIDTAKTNFWPNMEPKEEPALRLRSGSYRDDPKVFEVIEGVLYAFVWDNNTTSYAGGGTGPVPVRGYTAAQLMLWHGKTKRLGEVMKELYPQYCG